MAKIYIDNAKYMEFIDEIATQMTEMAYIDTDGSCIAYRELKNDLDNHIRFMFTDEAQDFYNERYDEVETLIKNTLNIYGNGELINDN